MTAQKVSHKFTKLLTKQTIVMNWVCFFFSLSHTLLYTHTHTLTHTHMHTDTYTSLSPTCLSFQSAFALLCSDTCSHSHLIIPSIYSGCACGSLSDYCMSCIECGLLLVVELRIRTLSCLAWSCWEFLVFSVSCCFLQWVRFHEVPRDWSPLDQIYLQFCFVIFLPVLCLRTTDWLVFCSFIKDCLD